MKKFIYRKMMMLIAITFCFTSFSSCEEEDTNAEYWFAGEWYVVDYSDNSPYIYNDTFYFYPDQRVAVESYYDGLIRGTWNITTMMDESYLNIYLPHDDYTPTIRGRLTSSGRNTIRLNVTDKDYGSYTLILSVDEYYNYCKKTGTQAVTKGVRTIPKKIEVK
ncbi:MAG: hypothetical protein RR386_04405 [Bacteroidaceae bacterium]